MTENQELLGSGDRNQEVMRRVSRLARDFAGTNSGDIKAAIASGRVSPRELGALFGDVLAEELE